jgi:predicted nucleic acid-binding protein
MDNTTAEIRRQMRREEAKERQVLRDKRTTADQLRVLDARLGVGEGAQKERERLQKLLIKEAFEEPCTDPSCIAYAKIRERAKEAQKRRSA